MNYLAYVLNYHIQLFESDENVLILIQNGTN